MFPRSDNEERFHQKASLSQAIDHQNRAMVETVGRLPEARLKATTLEQLADEIADKFSINIPMLDEPGIRPTRREIDIPVSRDRMRYDFDPRPPTAARGTELAITVPFKGDAELFRLHAGSHTMEYPLGQIGPDAITFRRRGVNLDAAQVRREFDDWLGQIKRHLAGMTQELGSFNVALKAEVVRALSARYQQLKRDDGLLPGLGFGSSQASS